MPAHGCIQTFSRMEDKFLAAALNGYGQVIVCVDRRNLAAHLLYEAQGFRLAAVHNSAYVMELDLRKK